MMPSRGMEEDLLTRGIDDFVMQHANDCRRKIRSKKQYWKANPIR